MMSDFPPDRLASHPSNAHYDSDALERGVGVRFKGGERTDVDEYCVSEGWIRVALGKKVDRRGAPLTIKLNGPVEVWYRDVGEGAASEDAEAGETSPPPAPPAA